MPRGHDMHSIEGRKNEMDDSNSGTLETIRKREDALYAAMTALDYAALGGLLSDDLSYVHSTGVVESKPA
jgi:hypothetical protein